MKNKEQVEEQFNKELGEDVRGAFLYDSFLDFISSIRQNDVDELIEWVEEKQKFFQKAVDGTTLSSVYAKAVVTTLNDLITHLKSIKESL
jgi:hypothetical protein